MSYSHIMFALGAVVLVLAGGFVAIILIDLLFDYFDGLTKWLAARQQEWIQHVRRIDHEAKRELRRLASRVPPAQPGGQMAGTSARPRGVSRSGAAWESVGNTTSQPVTYPWPAAERGCYCEICRYVRGMASHTVAPAGRGPGRGDPPKGIAH